MREERQRSLESRKEAVKGVIKVLYRGKSNKKKIQSRIIDNRRYHTGYNAGNVEIRYWKFVMEEPFDFFLLLN